MLYNGTSPCPDEQVLKLSDSFEKLEIPGLEEKPAIALELEVKVVNINEGRNSAIARRCGKLAEYSAFIAKARALEKELGDKEAAMKAAIEYCREHDILKEFLETHSSEVFNMLITEWNTEDAIAVAREEGREEGLERGLERGREDERKYVLELFSRGLAAEEIKQRLEQARI